MKIINFEIPRFPGFLMTKIPRPPTFSKFLGRKKAYSSQWNRHPIASLNKAFACKK